MKKLALLACLVSLPAFADIPLEVMRVTAPADLHSGDQTRALQAHDKVDESERVITGSGGRVALQFAEISTLTLGEKTELYIHSADPPDVGQGPVMRLQLEHGDLDIDARGVGDAPPQDFRVNAGAFSARTVGGHLWVTADSRGETLCAVAGSVEVNLGDSHYRLDAANDCIGHRSDTNEVQKASGAEFSVNALLARTSFDTEAGTTPAKPLHWVMGGNTTPPPVVATTPTTKPAATKPTAPAAKPAAPAAPTGGWGVVVASLEPAAAEQMKNKLVREGLHAALQTSAADASRQQVIIGDYKSADEARKQVATLKKRFKGAWVTQRREN